jgi:molybdate transport system substrate-binding protein
MKTHSLLAAALILLAQGAAVRADEIKVFASNAVRSVMDEVVPQFERASGHKLSIVYGSSNMLMDRIKGGEAADLTILTAPVIDELVAQGKVESRDRTDIARSGLGVSVRAGAPKPDIGSIDAFKRALLNARSVAYISTGASGAYFVGLIERLGIADQVKAKAKTMQGGFAGELVARGDAELAVQQIPELMAVSGTEFAGPFPPELQSITVFSAGVFADAGQAAAARALVTFLSTPAAARVIVAKGMQPR